MWLKHLKCVDAQNAKEKARWDAVFEDLLDKEVLRQTSDVVPVWEVDKKRMHLVGLPGSEEKKSDENDS